MGNTPDWQHNTPFWHNFVDHICSGCKGTGFDEKGPKEAKISVVRDEDNYIKYFEFQRKTKNGTGTKTDYFNVSKVDQCNGAVEWARRGKKDVLLLLHLSGCHQKMRNRWVTIDKSLGFLNFLICNRVLDESSVVTVRRVLKNHQSSDESSEDTPWYQFW